VEKTATRKDYFLAGIADLPLETREINPERTGNR
jgi:hypothetical protein